MEKKQKKAKTGDAQKDRPLVTKLNRYRHEYYNLAFPSVSNPVYDHLYDELRELEEKTGIIYADSPTQTVGYHPASALEKVRHPIPLLSLDKTKQTDVLQMAGKAESLLMLKLDGLTIKLCYENGELTEASTRGDGDVGELITHNIPAFYNVPLKIPHKERLVITGEGLIHGDDFEKMKNSALENGSKEACNARNLAAGSIRVLDPSVCKERHVYFYAFNVMEGMEAFGGIPDSRGKLLQAIQGSGFDRKLIPKKCPHCGKPVRIFSRAGEKGRLVETLHCDNPDCAKRILRKFVHFAGKKAMDMSGISESVIACFMEKGFLRTFHDFYHLDRYHDEIIRMDGFGEKSYRKIQESIDRSRNTTFVRYVVAMDIPMIGRTAGRILEQYFNGNLQEFAKAAVDCFDFTILPDFGEAMSRNIREWLCRGENLKLWKSLQKELHFEREEKDMKRNNTTDNPFSGCTIVATGKMENFTRNGINSKIISLGAVAGSSVTKKTDYLICGEKPGSKLAKAEELGITVLTEQKFLAMLSA